MSGEPDREVLLSMGFLPDRVDWAIQETTSVPGLQRRIEHIIEHENMTPPVVSSTIAEIHTETLFANQPTYMKADGADMKDFMKPCLCSAHNALDGAARSLEERYVSSLERFASFLQYEQELMHGALMDDKRASFKALKALEDFFRDEVERRRLEYGLPSSSESMQHQPTIHTSPSFPPAKDSISFPKRMTETLESAVLRPAQQSSASLSSLRPSISAHLSLRPTISVSPDIERILSRINRSSKPSPIVQQALLAAEASRPLLSERIQSLRSEFSAKQLPESQALDLQEQRRREVHSAHISALYQAGQMSTAGEVTRKFEASENSKNLVRKQTELDSWKKMVAEVGREGIMATLQELQVELKHIVDVLESGEMEVDVINTSGALLQVSDLMENEAVATLESLEDELARREHDYQRQSLSLNSPSKHVRKEVDNLDKAHELSKLELAVIRCDYKIKRTTPTDQLMLRRLKSQLKRVEADEFALSDALLTVLGTIPPTISHEDEEVRLAEGDDLHIKQALPSSELVEQIRAALSTFHALNDLAGEFSSCVQVVMTRQLVASREKALKEAMLSEFRAGKGDQVWLSDALKAVNQQYDQRVSSAEETAAKERLDREMRRLRVSEPASEILTRSNERENALLVKQAASLNVSGSSPVDEATFSRLLQQQQQQTQMASNMTWSQHASRMAVISNIGSGSTQWVVNYR